MLKCSESRGIIRLVIKPAKNKKKPLIHPGILVLLFRPTICQHQSSRQFDYKDCYIR